MSPRFSPPTCRVRMLVSVTNEVNACAILVGSSTYVIPWFTKYPFRSAMSRRTCSGTTSVLPPQNTGAYREPRWASNPML